MNNYIKKIINVSAFLFLIMLVSSCSDLFHGGLFYNDDDSSGFISISICSDKADSSGANDDPGEYAQAKTLLPQSQTTKYKLEFVSPENPSVTEWPITTASKTQTLKTGAWTLTVTMYEEINGTDYPVAIGTQTFNVVSGNNTAVNVYLAPIEGGTGHFSYNISSAIAVSGTLKLKKTAEKTEINIPLALGSNWAATLSDIPSGDYDVTVSLITSDGRGAGKYSTARIFPGLETTTETPVGEFFRFTSGNFVSNVYLAVKVNSTYIDLSVVPDEFVIYVYDFSDNLLAATTPSVWNESDEIIIPIDPGIPSVYFAVEINDSNVPVQTHKHILRNKPEIGIGENGRDGIVLYPHINTITPPGDAVNTVMLTKNAASPGELIYFNDVSPNGMKKGSLKYNEMPISSIVFDDNSFIMPDSAVVLSAVFFDVNLSGIGITPPGGVKWYDLEDNPESFNSGTPEYKITVPNTTHAIQVIPTALDSDVALDISVTGSGSMTNISTTDPTEIRITVTPPANLGGRGYNLYRLFVTREKSDVCTLSSLSVSEGTLFYDPLNVSQVYNVTVDNSVSSIFISAAALDSNATVEYSKIGDLTPYGAGTLSYSIPLLEEPNTNVIIVTVTAEDGSSTNIYTIEVTRKRLLHTDNTLSAIELLDSFWEPIIPLGVSIDNDVYTIRVEDSYAVIDEYHIRPVLSDEPFATATVVAVYDNSDDMYIYSILVTPECGSPVKQYTLIIYYEESEPEEETG